MGACLILGTISREGYIEPEIKPTGRGKVAEAAAEPEGECVISSTPVAREGYTGAARESESPARGTLRSSEASLGKHRFFPARRKGGVASHHDPFLFFEPLFLPPFLFCFDPPSAELPHSFAPCFGDKQIAQRWHRCSLRPQRFEVPWPIRH